MTLRCLPHTPLSPVLGQDLKSDPKIRRHLKNIQKLMDAAMQPDEEA